MVRFVDVDKADVTRLTESVSGPGFVYFEPGGQWHAMRPSSGFSMTSDGSLRDLEPGLWVSNLQYDRVNLLAKDINHIRVKSDGWFKITTLQMLSACGMSEAPPKRAAHFMAVFCDRIYRLSQEVFQAEITDPRQMVHFQRSIEKSPSLATGFTNLHHQQMAKGRPSEKRTIDMLDRSYQSGMYCFGRKKPEEGQINLSFHFPRLTYALDITSQPVPDRAVWQIASREPSQSSNDFIAEVDATGRPVIYRASYRQGSGMGEYVEAFIEANRRTDTYRSLFLPDEIRQLKRRIDLSVESAIAGGEWIQSSTGRILQHLVGIAGGRKTASVSWTVSIIAENILASAFRQDTREKAGRTVEAVWLAARDRVAMLGAIESFYEAGAILVAAQCGTITVQSPADPEMLFTILDTAWRHGMVLPIGESLRLAKLGVTPPSEASLFGGLDVDYILSGIAQTARKKALFTLDEVMDAPSGERREKGHALLH